MLAGYIYGVARIYLKTCLLILVCSSKNVNKLGYTRVSTEVSLLNHGVSLLDPTNVKLINGNLRKVFLSPYPERGTRELRRKFMILKIKR